MSREGVGEGEEGGGGVSESEGEEGGGGVAESEKCWRSGRRE